MMERAHRRDLLDPTDHVLRPDPQTIVLTLVPLEVDRDHHQDLEDMVAVTEAGMDLLEEDMVVETEVDMDLLDLQGIPACLTTRYHHPRSSV